MRWLIVCAVLALLAGCDATKGDFIITNLGVNFGPYDPATDKAGDFVFTMSANKVFLEFGAQVSSPDGVKELPTFEYRIDPKAHVMAITEGEIVRMVYQDETDDYEIGARSTKDPEFYVGYDHIKSPTVKMGDKLVSGQVLGNPGTWDATYGRFEIMINNDAKGLSYCPFVFFDPALLAEYQQKVSQLMQDWEAYKSDANIYDEDGHVSPGCRYESMGTY